MKTLRERLQKFNIDRDFSSMIIEMLDIIEAQNERIKVLEIKEHIQK